ncbi:MAG: glycosyltransferase [Actinomycetota bacterium]|nr:glycosyltransferase [Actinomycetota bacterium]
MPENKEKTKLLISIVSYNSLNYVLDLLQSIKENPPGFSYRTVVVDNASSDGTAEYISSHYRWVELITGTENIGFAAANNKAIKAFDSDYILLINSDCQVYPGAVEGLIDFLQSHQKAAVAGPKIINSDGSLQPSCRRFPSMFNAALHSLLVAVYPNNPFTRSYKLEGMDKSKPLTVDWVSGSCMAIRRQALDQVGLLR